MTTIARLMWTYFTGTPLLRGLSTLGIVLLAAGSAILLYLPYATFGTGLASGWPQLVQALLIAVPWLAIIVLFFASSLMPVIVYRMAFGRHACVLPNGRLLLYASAAGTAALLSLISAALVVLAFSSLNTPLEPREIFVRTLAISFVNNGIMYVVLWIISRLQGIWLLAGGLLAVLGVTMPLTYIGSPTAPLGWGVFAGLGGWGAVGALFMFGRRLRHMLGNQLARFARGVARLFPQAHYRPGAQARVLLGVGPPWTVALGQVIPILAATWLISVPGVWLFFLTLFSAVSGAITSFAAGRSRSLWLRSAWSRAELFHAVEAAYWRHNAYSLGVLVLLLVLLGSFLNFSTTLMALGIPLLALGAAVSSYLGLMMTKGLGWLEAVLAASTMALLMAAAILAADEDVSIATTAALEAVLVLLAVLYRSIAKSRWTRLDWMLCRDDMQAARSAA